MKKWISLACVCLQMSLFAASSGGGIGPSDIKRPPLVPPQKKPVPQAPIPAPVYVEPSKPSSAVAPTYTKPGILSYRNGQWAGTDHLYNISNTIPIVVDLAISDKLTLSASAETFQKRVEAAFIKEGINVSVTSTGKPPLPFFNVVVMAIPVGEGVTAYCSGRLFEIVDNDRSRLEQGVFWQAITWEDQQLAVASIDQATSEITATVDAIVVSFLERYNYFRKIQRP